METISIDAMNKPLGRLASRLALLLQGKNLPGYRPEKREGSHITVYNIAEMRLSGKKAVHGVRYSHSGYPGGLKKLSVKRILEKDPRILPYMLPSKKLP